MRDLADLRMPHHRISDAEGSSIPAHLKEYVCNAVTRPGYAYRLEDGRLRCSICGWVTQEPVVEPSSQSYRQGVLQIPVVLEGFLPYAGREHRAIGVRCPRCCKREVVYNGNYFCSGFDDAMHGTGDGGCGWALGEHGDPVEDPETGLWYDVPRPLWDLDDMLVLIGCAKGRRGSAW